MSNASPPLNALRAFEAAARHLSVTRAAHELRVTPGALSHQIRGLEDFLGVSLFARQPRGIVLTAAGKLLYPGLQAGFGLIRDAVAGLRAGRDEQVLVVSTPPGFTAKWLAARLYRFTESLPDIELRIAASAAYADFNSDGVDLAIRNLPVAQADAPGLVHEKLVDADLLAVCSPSLLARLGPLDPASMPLIHDEQLAGQTDVPTWADWLTSAGVAGGDVGRGLHFSNADHALAAALEGAGVLLTHALLAHDDLRSGRLLQPFALTLPSRRAYYLVYPQAKPGAAQGQARRQAFCDWLRAEMALLDLPSH